MSQMAISPLVEKFASLLWAEIPFRYWSKTAQKNFIKHCRRMA